MFFKYIHAMLKVGITGGIGSGKSTVATIFDLFGVPVYNSDVRAKEMTAVEAATKVKCAKV